MRRGNLGRALALLAGVVLVSCTETPISSLNKEVTPTVQRDNTPSGDTHLVISQVYGAGGNSGSTLKNDYIEIFNPTGTAVKVDGWSVQYQSSAGTGTMQVTSLSGVIQPGRYYLVQEAQGSGGSVSLPTPDAVGGISMSGTNGKVALAKTTAAYSGLCANDANVVDEVSFGPSSTGCGSTTASNLTATTAATRGGAGCTNTGATSADFTNVTAAPRNSATTRNLCVAATEVAPFTASTTVGASPVSFTATAFTPTNTVNAGATFTWSTSDAAIATVDAGGNVTPLASGDVQVRATSSAGVTGVAFLHVNAAVLTVTTVAVSPTSASLVIGGANQQFTASAKDQNNDPIVTTFTWSSDAPAIASVNASGLVSPVAAGDANITATAPNGVHATATVHVDPAIVPPPPLVITEFMADPSAVADAKGEWFEVYNPTASSVSLLNWKVISNGDGTHTINVPVTIPAGGYVVLGNNTDASTNGGITEAWGEASFNLANSNANESIILKDNFGQTVDSVKYGTGFLPKTGYSHVVIDPAGDNAAADGNDWQDASSSQTYGGGDHGTPGSGNYANLGPAVTLTVSPNPAFVGIGSTFQLRAFARDANNNSVLPPLTWTSDNTSAVTVDPNSGVVTGVTTGNANVTAHSSNGLVATTLVRSLGHGVAAFVSLVPKGDSQQPAGFWQEVFTTVKDAYGVALDPQPSLTWTSDDASIAGVDQRNYIIGVSPGQTRVHASTSDGATGSLLWTIVPSTAPTTAVYGNHLELGQPSPGTGSDDVIYSKNQYVLSYNATRGGPNWVSWDLNATHFGAAPRCDCFTPDPTIPNPVEDYDFRGGGYDRGHMTTSEQRTSTAQENATTFYMSNMLPQAGPNNQGPWAQFEIFLNDLARVNGKEIYIVSGGQYAANPTTLKGLGRVAIPDYTWKVAVVMAGGAGVSSVHSPSDVQVYAIRIPNLLADTVGMRSTPWQTYQVKVDDIEAATGYDLLSALPDNIEIAVESGTHIPVAAIDQASYSVNAHDALTVSGSTSHDDDAGQVLTFSWNFGDGSGWTSSATHTYSQSGNFTLQLIATDPLGIADTATASVHVTDTTAPVVAHTVTGTAGSNDWFVGDVHVSWSASDPESGITSAPCAAVDVTSDTNSSTYSCVATNGEGLSTTDDVTLKRDASLPVVSYTGNLGTYSVADTIHITCTPSDVGPSGLASSTCADVNVAAMTLTLGSHTYSATATDNAGNVGSGSASFTVTVSTSSLSQLVKSFESNAGQQNAMLQQLAAAGDAISRGDIAAKAGQVGAFINYVDAQRGKTLTAAQADLLITLARGL